MPIYQPKSSIVIVISTFACSEGFDLKQCLGSRGGPAIITTSLVTIEAPLAQPLRSHSDLTQTSLRTLLSFLM